MELKHDCLWKCKNKQWTYCLSVLMQHNFASTSTKKKLGTVPLFIINSALQMIDSICETHLPAQKEPSKFALDSVTSSFYPCYN